MRHKQFVYTQDSFNNLNNDQPSPIVSTSLTTKKVLIAIIFVSIAIFVISITVVKLGNKKKKAHNIHRYNIFNKTNTTESSDITDVIYDTENEEEVNTIINEDEKNEEINDEKENNLNKEENEKNYEKENEKIEEKIDNINEIYEKENNKEINELKLENEISQCINDEKEVELENEISKDIENEVSQNTDDKAEAEIENEISQTNNKEIEEEMEIENDNSSNISKDGYNLIWNDEFTDNSIDTSKWDFDLGNGVNGWGNNELEYYTNRSDNIYISNNILHIRERKEDYGGQSYTSARILTKGKFELKFGYIEARIALPSGLGIWPAFWMLGKNFDQVSWPACGEIDIIEAINNENKIYSTCHWQADGNHAEYGKSTETFDINNFHTYYLQWDTEYIRAGVDGKQHYEILIKDGTGQTDAFQESFFFVLNVAVGGNWPGFNIDDSQFPTEMQVDYIRVYQKNE